MDKFDTLKKRGENIVDSSRIYYGETRVNIKELIETNRKGFIKLEYYGTKQTIENEIIQISKLITPITEEIKCCNNIKQRVDKIRQHQLHEQMKQEKSQFEKEQETNKKDRNKER